MHKLESLHVRLKQFLCFNNGTIVTKIWPAKSIKRTQVAWAAVYSIFGYYIHCLLCWCNYVWGMVCISSLFCDVVLGLLSSLAIISLRKRKPVALL